MQALPLTQCIGLAERSMRALLECELQAGGLSFADWTVLVFTGAAPCDAAELIRRQLDGHIVPDAADARKTIDRLVGASLIVRQENLLVQSAKGTALFSGYSCRASELARVLYGDLPEADLVVTQRTLMEIATRANKLLKTKGATS